MGCPYKNRSNTLLTYNIIMANAKGNPNWKGKSGNPAGRKKGVVSVKMQKWHMLADYLMDEGMDRLLNAMEQLEPKEFVDAYSKILNYIKPKLSSVDQNSTEGIRIIITNELDDPKREDSEDSAS